MKEAAKLIGTVNDMAINVQQYTVDNATMRQIMEQQDQPSPLPQDGEKERRNESPMQRKHIAQGTETIPDEPPIESSGKVRQEICFLSNGRHVFQCNLVEEVVSRQPGSEEMDDNEEYALFFEVIKKLGSPRKFSMPKMQKFSVIANSIDHIQ
ncbi:Hypothetical predicted protein [Olea europaea subsp. europaea]|uniref:Uncharacterized protein n=1 Tax=Olea europaea subsp. europaea TaxID=158383 RepID=A0A8S0TS19_OLEEU|nr:Hypothetical predicted protein [Olea europaea subsp. europaea]